MKYMIFDTQHVNNSPKRTRKPLLCEKSVKIVWMCVNDYVKVPQTITIQFSSSSTCFWYQNVGIFPKIAKKQKLHKNVWKCGKMHENVWKLHECAWRSVWNCFKVSPRNFSAQVYDFWYPTCWNWPKNDRKSPNWMKIVWKLCENCVKVYEGVAESVWNSEYSMSLLSWFQQYLKLPKWTWHAWEIRLTDSHTHAF